jgi:hypothetical protein
VHDPQGTALRIRRARGYRLYGVDGRRYLDLHQDGGRAILGHRGGRAVTAMKNALSEGLHSSLPSVYEARLMKALARAFPGCRCIRLFASESRALEAVSRALAAHFAPSDIFDPAVGAPPGDRPRVARWRPFLPAECAAWLDGAEALLPILPFAAGEAPTAVCFRDGQPSDFLESDALPGFLLAGVLTAFSAVLAGDGASSAAADENLRPVERALDSSRTWARRGRYVRALFDAAAYPGIHRQFLQGGVLLGPSHPGPSILPAECSPGEGRLLAGLFLGIPGG